MRRFMLLSCLLALAGCAGLRPYSFSGLKTGLPKETIVKAWGKPAVIPRTMEMGNGTVLEIYQYERGRPRDIYTLYFRSDKLWRWDKRDWRGTSESERTPAKK